MGKSWLGSASRLLYGREEEESLGSENIVEISGERKRLDITPSYREVRVELLEGG